MRPCTRRIMPAEDVIKATSLNDALGEHAPWCRTAPTAPLLRTKPLVGRPAFGFRYTPQPHVQDLLTLREEARLRQQPEPLDGRHQAPLQPEPPAGPDDARGQGDARLRVHALPQGRQSHQGDLAPGEASASPSALRLK